MSKYKNFEIWGNEFRFDKEGNIIDFEVKINSVGKKLVITNERVGYRKNIILLGDILADVNMVENVDYDNLLAIGFLNEPKDLKKEVQEYFTKYDVVIANDGSMEEVNNILKEIIEG